MDWEGEGRYISNKVLRIRKSKWKTLVGDVYIVYFDPRMGWLAIPQAI